MNVSRETFPGIFYIGRDYNLYIQPQTNIRILSGVPLDSDYQHTLYFDSREAQAAYFLGKTKYNFTDSVYQRVNKGSMRIGINAENLYNCNYLMFQNTAFGSKWFYAFITSVEYANDNATDINFTIDVMQTWLFDVRYEESYIDRTHTKTDNIGDHIEPEPVELGEYVYNTYTTPTPSFENKVVIIADSGIATGETGNLYNGVYSGCVLHAFNSNNINAIAAYILKKTAAGKGDEIVSIYMAPAYVVNGTGERLDAEHDGQIIEQTLEGFSFTRTYNKLTTDLGYSLDGYKPVNNKMYTYPYNYLCINAPGGSLVLRYEFFKDLTPIIKFTASGTQPVTVLARPVNYKGSGDDTLNSETLTLTNYPTCSWSNDSFVAYLAQNAPELAEHLGTDAIKAVGGVATIASGAAVGSLAGPVGAIAGIASDAMSLAYKASISTVQQRGNVSNASGDQAAGTLNFYGGRMSVNRVYAKMIDNFFTMYGYRVATAGIPQFNNRPEYTYIKTRGCCASGDCPADDLKQICGIIDKGITFWKKPEHVGNYDVDNRPVTGA